MNCSEKKYNLRALLDGVVMQDYCGDLCQEITGIAHNSKEVKPGFVFVALKGSSRNGCDFVSEAVDRGAKVIITETALETIPGVTFVQVPHGRKALARIAVNFWSDPSSQLKVVGITGTNGKTTTSFLLEAMVRRAGYCPGVIGTVNYRFKDQILKASHTTPESLELQRVLARMSEVQVSHVIMEVSSHALEQERVAGVGFDVGVFTNLTPEHLDFHGTLERYAQSKARLFSRFLEESRTKGIRFAVLNQDDPQTDYFRSLTTARLIRYGMGKSVDITIEEARVSSQGISGLLKTPQGSLTFSTSLLGRFNFYNIMAAAGAALALDLNLDAIGAALHEGIRVPGRMERVGEGIDYTVLVDYAHTPDALENVLSSIRDFKGNRIITVFGCGGDRDRTKRPVMGRIAARLSDIVIITSDNPRTERPETIIEQVEQGVEEGGLSARPLSSFGNCRNGGKGYHIVTERKEAIRLALRIAQTNDVVLIAGKGHEDYQLIGTQSIAFDDRKEIVEALRSKEEKRL